MRKIIVLLVVAAFAVPALAIPHSEDLGCDACHAAHSDGTVAGPLWIVAGPGTDATTFKVATDYSDSSIKSVSLLCMGCHDTGSTLNTHAIAENQVDQTALGTQHPIGVAIPGEGRYSASGAVTAEMVEATDSEITCGSCHELHAGAVGDAQLKFATDDGELCNKCHVM